MDKSKGSNEGKSDKGRTYYSQVLANAHCEPYEATTEDFSWFCMKNYQFIRNLSLRNIICELAIRTDLGIVANTKNDHGIITKPLFDEIYADITSGKPSISARFSSDISRPELIKLAEDFNNNVENKKTPIRELNAQDIYDCHDALSAGDGETYSLSQLNSPHPCCCINKTLPENKTEVLLTELQSSDVELVYLSVDPSYSDRQLIDSFKQTLKCLREKNHLLTVNEDKAYVLSKNKFLSIGSASIIPLMDLVIWQVNNKKALGVRQIYNLLKSYKIDARAADTLYNSGNFVQSVLELFEQIIDKGRFTILLNTLRLKTSSYEKSFRDAGEEL